MNEPWKDALEDGIKNFMWSMFWKGNQRANLEQLEESCQKLIRLTSQKDAGQRGNNKSLNFDNAGMIYNEIAIEAVSLVLDPRFDRLKQLFQETEVDQDEWNKALEEWRGRARAEEWASYWEEHRPKGGR